MIRRDGMARWSGSLGMVLLIHGAVVAGLAGVGAMHSPSPPETPPIAMLIDLAPAAEPPPREPSRAIEPPVAPPPKPQPTPPPRPKALKLPPPPLMPSQPVAREPEPSEIAPAAVATTPSPIPSPSPSHPMSSAAATTWQGRLLAHLERYRRYPNSARFHRQQGVAGVAFSMDRQGRLLAVKLRTSSGVESLDEESLELMRRAQPLPPPPLEVEGERLDLVVPVEFFLSQR